MKVYIVAIVTAILFSSCLKQSISDAMLNAENGEMKSITATLSYKINGNSVNIQVDDADKQSGNYTLGCSKATGYYALQALSDFGETSFIFYTDSLTNGNYKYTANYGDMFFIDYNNTNEFVHAPSDSMSFNITSYDNGHISGNFSGKLTPLITAGNPNNIYGEPGSVLITNGSFQNVPVFY